MEEGAAAAAERVDARLAAEISALDVEIRDLEKLVPKQQRAAEKAAKADRGKGDEDEKERTWHRAERALGATIDQLSFKRKKREALSSPAERDRRIRLTDKLEGVRQMAAKKTSKETAKDQGFPAAYLGENGNFRPGMDARAKSDLINAVLGIESPDALHKFPAAEAKRLIGLRQWNGFLERKRQIVEAKAEAAAKKAEEKEEAAREKAAAKAAKADAKTSNVTPIEAGKKDVTPDPKPTSTRKSRSRKS